MNTSFKAKIFTMLLFISYASQILFGGTYYVSPFGSGTPPYDTWATAATNIQDAVDAASAGDTVLVTNGIYAAGGMKTPGYNLSNRVIITKALIVSSVNGPGHTLIQGAGPLGNGAVRCAYLTNGAQLTGFTLTNGYTLKTGNDYMDRGGGGALLNGDVIISNCNIIDCSAAFGGGGVLCYYGGTVKDCRVEGNHPLGSGGSWDAGGGVYVFQDGLIDGCIIITNTSRLGGGVYCKYGGIVQNCTIQMNFTSERGGGLYLEEGGSVSNCTFKGNVSDRGGAVYCMNGGQVIKCTITGNKAAHAGDSDGGGVYINKAGVVIDCTINNNFAHSDVEDGNGGGVFCNQGGLVERCMIFGNSATSNFANAEGGGVVCDSGGIIRNCLIVENSATDDSGGVACWHDGPVVQNCTIVSNSAESGGGLELWNGGQVVNCIVYYNTADDGPNYWMNVTNILYTCTTPLVAGAGNITNSPVFINIGAGDFRLSSVSPCINTGTNVAWMTGATDLDGRPRIIDDIVDMGTYEFAPYPIISVIPVIIDFGLVPVFNETNKSARVKNIGSGVLTGAVQNVVLPFSIDAASPSSYILSEMAGATITFRFAPTDIDGYSNSVAFTGGDGASVILTGESVPEPGAGFLILNFGFLIRLRKFSR